MNLVDAVVTKVRLAPYERYNVWWVEVEYDSWGCISNTSLFFDTEDAALQVGPGYKFVC